MLINKRTKLLLDELKMLYLKWLVIFTDQHQRRNIRVVFQSRHANNHKSKLCTILHHVYLTDHNHLLIFKLPAIKEHWKVGQSESTGSLKWI